MIAVDVRARIEQSMTGERAPVKVDRIAEVEKAVARREVAQRWEREGTTAAELIRQSVKGGDSR